jgi:hypothetical protein
LLCSIIQLIVISRAADPFCIADVNVSNYSIDDKGHEAVFVELTPMARFYGNRFGLYYVGLADARTIRAKGKK